jgi:hypothetical protein
MIIKGSDIATILDEKKDKIRRKIPEVNGMEVGMMLFSQSFRVVLLKNSTRNWKSETSAVTLKKSLSRHLALGDFGSLSTFIILQLFCLFSNR